MDAEYVFRVRVRIDPAGEHVRVDPATFETTLYRRADPPGDEGWLFFRDNLWRGEVNDEKHHRAMAEEALDVPVDSVAFSALRTDEAYFDGLKAEIAESLDLFNADSVSEVISKYLGSSVEVQEGDA
ncbi:LWR-salt protein [Halostella sp. PRR32]|uniref:LWR-salt protein n=1 Tax=Halostella sp. PRR32 TaxID=3098147 RepID=UPI002B1E6CE1|nr:LWR-salt protein [Halostella sp. PRR32]